MSDLTYEGVEVDCGWYSKRGWGRMGFGVWLRVEEGGVTDVERASTAVGRACERCALWSGGRGIADVIVGGVQKKSKFVTQNESNLHHLQQKCIICHEKTLQATMRVNDLISSLTVKVCSYKYCHLLKLTVNF